MKPFLPPITPEGVFKFEINFHDENKSLMVLETVHEVKHIGLSDFIGIG